MAQGGPGCPLWLGWPEVVHCGPGWPEVALAQRLHLLPARASLLPSVWGSLRMCSGLGPGECPVRPARGRWCLSPPAMSSSTRSTSQHLPLIHHPQGPSLSLHFSQEETRLRAPGLWVQLGVGGGAQPGSAPTVSVSGHRWLPRFVTCQKPSPRGTRWVVRDQSLSETRLSQETLTKSVRPTQMRPVHHSARGGPAGLQTWLSHQRVVWPQTWIHRPDASPRCWRSPRPLPALTQPCPPREPV